MSFGLVSRIGQLLQPGDGLGVIQMYVSIDWDYGRIILGYM